MSKPTDDLGRLFVSFLLIFKNLLLIERELLYSILLASVIHQHE